MKVLFVLPPTPEKPGYPEPPAGLLYVASAIKRAGHDPVILDIYRNFLSPGELLETVRSGGFEVVGFGGITTCYKYVREAARLLRQELPSVHLIAGGVLSSTYELLLHNTPIDVVCLREGELTAVNVMNCLAEGRREFEGIRGVAFLKDGRIHKTSFQPYIDNLDDIPFPDYSLIDMNIYAFDAMKDPHFAADPESRSFYRDGMRVFNIKTARGCTNACTFCYRHFLGYRQNSIDYVIGHIRYLQEKYDIHFLRFGDELFTRNRQWVMEFTRRVMEEDVRFRYIVHGVRTDNVEAEMMRALHKSGCAGVYIGFESGSQKMLDVMKKGVSLERNIDAVKTILDSGLKVLVQVVIGMPGENRDTIAESIDSLIRTGVDAEWISINYAQAYPGTWLWRHALTSGLIKNAEGYLLTLGSTNTFLLNYTDVPWSEAEKWSWRIRRGLLKAKYRKTRRLGDWMKSLDPRVLNFMMLYERYGLGFALKETVKYLWRFVSGKAA
jgi:anaerobic magnesium-protoporphyrin IX monomethyl ester cyclase